MAQKADVSRRREFKRAFARTLRAGATDAERKLWSLLRTRQLAGFRFRRQQPIGPYIADFFCPSARLIVELDGDQHGAAAAIMYDQDRTRFLQSRGYRVLRFSNGDVPKSSDLVLEAIRRALTSFTP
jgi:very-short-patch-repair endonuclease